MIRLAGGTDIQWTAWDAGGVVGRSGVRLMFGMLLWGRFGLKFACDAPPRLAIDSKLIIDTLPISYSPRDLHSG